MPDFSPGTHSYHSSTPCDWVQPRPHRDASLRYMKHGPLRPMHEPSWWQRLLSKVAK